MIAFGMELHNVAELAQRENGFALPRLDAAVRAGLDTDAGRDCVFLTSGSELRFRMVSDTVRLYLHMEDTTEGLPANIYYGCFQGPWAQSAKAIGRESTCLTIEKPKNLEHLLPIAEAQGHPFSPELVRILLPCCKCVLERVEGEILPPRPGDTPAKTLLTYGSSITHGSLAMGAPHTYAYKLATGLGFDLLNLGMAGCCRLEESVLRRIFSSDDWDMATVEIGINMLGDFDDDAFRARVRRFADLAEADPRPVYVTSIFRCINEGDKLPRFRRIVREEISGRLPFTDGTDLLDDPAMVAADLVHPSLEGHITIADRWLARIRAEQ